MIDLHTQIVPGVDDGSASLEQSVEMARAAIADGIDILAATPMFATTGGRDLGLVHLLASDAHAPAVRTIGMSAAARAVGDDATARWLTREVPAAIVEGAPLPVAPEPRSRRRGRLLGRPMARG